MEFDVYCDESYPDLLISKKSDKDYLVIGSLWLPTSLRKQIKEEIHYLRDKHKIGGEFKWGKVSPSRVLFYNDLVDYFFSKKLDLRFRAIVINKNDVNLYKYHQNDQELGFYKFYYQVLQHWILDFNKYSIFLDYKKNRDRSRLHTLQNCLSCGNLSSDINIVQAVKSDESVLIQLTDFFTGITAGKFNDKISSKAKNKVIKRVEHHLKRKIAPTGLYEKKYNVFKINLSGGW